MRTVTFSNPEVAKAVNEKFVATWVNREPGFHNCDSHEESTIQQYKYDSFATRNFCTFFTTPDLDVLHYASGYYHPHYFLREIGFVHKLRRAVLDARLAFGKDSISEFRGIHLAQAKAREREAARISKLGRPAGISNVEVFLSRRHYLEEGIRHLAAVHKNLALKAAAHEGPIPLTEVFNDHLYGNGFQETVCGDRNCKRPDEPGMK